MRAVNEQPWRRQDIKQNRYNTLGATHCRNPASAATCSPGVTMTVSSIFHCLEMSSRVVASQAGARNAAAGIEVAILLSKKERRDNS